MKLQRNDFIKTYTNSKGEEKRIDLEWYLKYNYSDSLESLMFNAGRKSWVQIKKDTVRYLENYFDGDMDYKTLHSYITYSEGVFKMIGEDKLISAKRFIKENEDLGVDYIRVKTAEKIFETL